MADKWVDTNSFFGPDRRRRGAKRWNDRRRFDETSEPPALAAMLRRLRVLLTDMSDRDNHARALQLLAASIITAERLHLTECAEALKRADRTLRTAAPNEFDRIDPIVVEALGYVA